MILPFCFYQKNQNCFLETCFLLFLYININFFILLDFSSLCSQCVLETGAPFASLAVR